MNKINEVIGLILMTNGEALKDSDNANSIENWDSVTHIVLLTAIEEEFGFKFTDEQMENISTIGEIRKAASEKAKA
jgi:acyl carrier protein